SLYRTTHTPPSLTIFPYTTLFRSRNTAYRYLNNDEWQKEYRQKRNELTDTLTSHLLQLGTQAIETLENNMTDPDATPATKNTTRSEEHSLNSSHVSISYAVFCLKK